MKLNIGGDIIKDGWKILNIQSKPGVDFIGDISDLSQFDNNSIEEQIVTLNENNVNVDVQSIIKKDDQTVIVLKLSDFDLTKLSLVEEFFITCVVIR